MTHVAHLLSTQSVIAAAALAVSGALHATVLLVPPAMSVAVPGGIEPVAGVDVELVEEAAREPTPAPTQEPAAPVESWVAHTHPYPVPASHDATPHDPSIVHAPAKAEAPAPAAAALTAGDDGPSFSISVSTGDESAHGAVTSSPAAATTHDEPREPLAESAVDRPARLVRGLAPSYPEAARAAGVEGDVRLEIVVDASGAVESARVLSGMGRGLDEAALAAMRQFRFAPATLAGRAVRVRMRWSMQFRLQ